MRPAFVDPTRTGEQYEKQNGAVAQKGWIKAHERLFVARFGEFVQQSLLFGGEFHVRDRIQQRPGLALAARPSLIKIFARCIRTSCR